ncbi:MAG: hypothetical protein NT165_01400 [Candidatus Falkowbacteria bacterium]|nr:hypothetical protein [Candidatus Falkowbacteria bacterium]
MKKILVFSMIFSLVLVSGNFVLAQEVNPGQGPDNQKPKNENKPPMRPAIGQNNSSVKTQPEKISSPSEMGLFEKIKKVGNELFGVRKQNVQPKKDDNKKPMPVADGQNLASGTMMVKENPNSFMPTSSTDQLEKISSPGDMNLFDKIKKVGTALFGVRKGDGPKPMLIKPEFAQCVKDAINKKGLAVKAVVSAHNQALVAALDSRLACELAAVDKTSAQEQFDANQLCISADQKTRDESEGTFNKAREDAQKTFQTDVKQCLGSFVQNSSSTNPIAN